MITLLAQGQSSSEEVMDCQNLKFKKGLWLINKIPFSGYCQTIYKNGNLASESDFINELLHAKLKMYYESGQIQEITEYLNGSSNGKVIYYYEDGGVSEEGIAENGVKKSENIRKDQGAAQP